MNKNKKQFEHRSQGYKGLKEYPVKRNCELLEFLFETFKDQSRNSVKSLLGSHRVTVDGAPVTQFNFKLVPGDIVIITREAIRKKIRSNLPIIYEDKDLIVINKPSGLLSIPSDKEKGSTAYRVVTDYVQQKDKHNRIYVVNRLDEDTSGVLMFVKNEKLQEAFTKDWNNLVSKRGYFAIVDGVMEKDEGTVKSYLKMNAQNMMYSSKKAGDGKLSITHYKVMKRIENYTLLDINIDSGRKNQIRVHMGDIGHFVIGDDKYGNPTNPIKRLGLHSYCLEIMNPLSHKKMKFNAPIPKEFSILFPKQK